MTLNDIKLEVAALGFDDGVGSSSHFVYSVRRALSLIFSERAVISELRLYKSLPPIRKAQKRILHSPGIDNVTRCEKGAYSFFVSGKGSFSVADARGERKYSFDTGAMRYSGFVKGEGSIRFYGDLCFSVYSFFLFPGYITESESDIPTLSGYEEYRLDTLCPDFFSSEGAPRDGRGDIIRSSSVTSGVVKIPSEYEGEIVISYKRRPPEVTQDSPDLPLELPTEILHLVPLITASYIWLDDDPDKAYYYMSLYREGMAAVKRGENYSRAMDVRDVSGWAT